MRNVDHWRLANAPVQTFALSGDTDVTPVHVTTSWWRPILVIEVKAAPPSGAAPKSIPIYIVEENAPLQDTWRYLGTFKTFFTVRHVYW